MVDWLCSLASFTPFISPSPYTLSIVLSESAGFRSQMIMIGDAQAYESLLSLWTSPSLQAFCGLLSSIIHIGSLSLDCVRDEI